jgi:hypothetical protein
LSSALTAPTDFGTSTATSPVIPQSVKSALQFSVLPTSSKHVATWLVKLDTATALQQLLQFLTEALTLEAMEALHLGPLEAAELLKDHPHPVDHALVASVLQDRQDLLDKTEITETTEPLDLTEITVLTLQPANNLLPPMFASTARQDRPDLQETPDPKDPQADQETTVNQVPPEVDPRKDPQDRQDHLDLTATQDLQAPLASQVKSTMFQEPQDPQDRQDHQAHQVQMEIQEVQDPRPLVHQDPPATLAHQAHQEMPELQEIQAAMARLDPEVAATTALRQERPQAIEERLTYHIDLEAIKTVSCSPTSPAVFLSPLFICIVVHAKTKNSVAKNGKS